MITINQNFSDQNLNHPHKIIWDLNIRNEIYNITNIYLNIEGASNQVVDKRNTPNGIVNNGLKIHSDFYQNEGMDDQLRKRGIHEFSGTDQIESQDKIYKNIPAYAKWFDFSKVHQEEEESLPEFFGEKISKSPEIYIKIRNFVVRLYWKNPERYLTSTSIRRAVSGDIGSIMRLHAFLEYWGLINFNFNLDKNQNLPKMIANMSFPKRKSFEGSFEKLNGKDCHAFEKSNDILLQSVQNQPSRCFECNGLLKPIWFTKKDLPFKIKNEKYEKISLCQSCYLDEKFPIYFNKQDFQRESLNSLEIKEDKPWTLDEKERLIRLIMEGLPEVDWNQIALEFPHHQKEEIIVTFLKIPFDFEQNDELDLLYKKDGRSLMEIFKSKFNDISRFVSQHRRLEIEDQRNGLTPPSSNKIFQEIIETQSSFMTKKISLLNSFEKLLYNHKQKLAALSKYY